MTNEEHAQAALAALRTTDADARPSPSVEVAVLAAFDRQYAVRTNWTRWGAIAATLTLAVGLSLFVAGDYESGTRTTVSGARMADSGARTSGSEQRTADHEVSDFVAWPGAAVLPEFEGGELVRTTLPATVLPLLGIPPADAPVVDGHVVADVLYGQDGQPRAVRVVNSALRP